MSKWIQVLPYLKDGEVKICGTKKEAAADKYCRPTIKVNNNTPMTVNELVDKHGKDAIIEFLENRKSKRQVDWIDLK